MFTSILANSASETACANSVATPDPGGKDPSRAESRKYKSAPPDDSGGALSNSGPGSALETYDVGTRSTNQITAGAVNAAVCGAEVPATDRGK